MPSSHRALSVGGTPAGGSTNHTRSSSPTQQQQQQQQAQHGKGPPPAGQLLHRSAGASSSAASSSSRHKHGRLSQCLVLVLCAAAVAFIASTYSLHAARVRANPIGSHEGAQPVDPQAHVASERMLRMLVEECAKGEDSVISVDPDGTMLVQAEADATHCPIMDIMLRGSERGIGMCTDAALYVLHLGARLLGNLSDPAAYDAGCGPATARLFLETMYAGFVSRRRGVLHLLLLNAEHMWAADAGLHRRMNVFLCKTRVCEQLMSRHVADRGYAASVWLVGHTSNDPSVDLPPSVRRHRDKLSFLHVKGKSGLKHTRQLLECWRGRPDLPPLTVVGRFSWEEVRDSAGARNIVFYPKVTSAFNATQTEHISFQQVRNMQVQNLVHICASEREGFGHYINEARAVGAFVISTDHPPMNELVTPETGLLIPPRETSSYPQMALAPYGPINAFLNASQLCRAADDVLALPLQEVEARGRQARAAYLHDDAVFLHRLQDLRAYLRSHAEARQVTAPRSGFLQQQLRRQPWRHLRRRLAAVAGGSSSSSSSERDSSGSSSGRPGGSGGAVGGGSGGSSRSSRSRWKHDRSAEGAS